MNRTEFLKLWKDSMKGKLVARFHGEYEGWTITKVTDGYFAGCFVLRDENRVIRVNASDLDFVLTWIQ